MIHFVHSQYPAVLKYFIFWFFDEILENIKYTRYSFYIYQLCYKAKLDCPQLTLFAIPNNNLQKKCISILFGTLLIRLFCNNIFSETLNCESEMKTLVGQLFLSNFQRKIFQRNRPLNSHRDKINKKYQQPTPNVRTWRVLFRPLLTMRGAV